MTVVLNRIDPVGRAPAAAGSGSPRAPVSVAKATQGRGKAGQDKLYQPRTPIYPKLVHGRWRTIKWALLVVTLGVYYVAPWLRSARPGSAPQQAILVDFAHQRFYFFAIRLWPQEVYFITGLLVMAALALFLTTALFGRLWCGYACPQTVWTDLYIAVERLFEGDRNARMRLDAAPLSLDKVGRKGGKHLAWLVIAMATGGAWALYFQDAPTLWNTFWIGQAPVTAYVSVGLLTFTTYALAGTMREQVCTYMCPWPRIQGAMLDDQSFQVTYRRDRGEPRGAHKKDQAWAGRGDCVDCAQCVVVCPMGIDIREGSQIECINCGLCVDACDAIMDKLERPRALIAYDTDAAVLAREQGRPVDHRLIRPRTIVYAGALAFVGGLMAWGLTHRPSEVLEALHDRNPIYVVLKDGSVRDGYTLKIDNRTFERRTYSIGVEGLPGALLKTPGAAATGGVLAVTVDPDEVRAMRVFVTAPAAVLDRANLPITFTLRSTGAPARIPSIFLSGTANPS